VAQDELPFRVDLLGRFRLSVAGAPASEPLSSRGRELLALLVVERGNGIARESIASRMWPGSGEAQARTNLRRELHQLRAAFPRSEQAIESRLPTPHSTMHLYPLNGAAARVTASDTAYRHREALWSQVIVGVDPSPAKADELRKWTVAYHEALHPYSTGAAYVNFMMDEGTDRIRATYGANFERLQLVKRAYDPENFFRVN
jgi:hypothetical protein